MMWRTWTLASPKTAAAGMQSACVVQEREPL